MATKLCVGIEMFALNQYIFISEDGEVKLVDTVPMDKVSETICSITNARDVEEIEINGNSQYIQKVGYDVLDHMEKFYSNRDVRIKLNGEVFN